MLLARSTHVLLKNILRPLKEPIIIFLYFYRFRPDRALKLLSQRRAARSQTNDMLVALCIDDDGTVVRVRAGTHDIDIFDQIFLMRDCAPPRRIDPQLIIDGGAHVGCSAISFARAFPRAQIIAVEADKNNYNLLKMNASAYKNISCVHGAIWRDSEPLIIENPESDPWDFRVAPLAGPECAPAVRGITIDELLTMSGKDQIDLLKLDIEGAEREVFLATCDSWLSSTLAIIIELHDRVQPGCSEAFFSAIDRFGFKVAHRSAYNITVVRHAPS